MTSARPVSVAILWHMHQPWYGEPDSGRMVLPWTRLHATKDYLDMIEIARRQPNCHLTFNLVPSLLLQLEAYATGQTSDEARDTARLDTAELTEAQRLAWLRYGFHVQWQRQVEPHRRYRELLERRGREPGRLTDADLLRRFGVAELRDLQVWFHLAWCGQVLRAEEPVAGLLRQGRDYSEDDKQALLDAMDEAVRRVIPAYVAAARDGHVELSTTPLYHPILPLLCHYPDVKVAMPGASIPPGARDLPEDAAAQLEQGLAVCERLLGFRPVGLWPSEGSVSTRALEVAAAAGFRWAASDEQILGLSLHHGRAGAVTPAAMLRPYRHAGLELFFRDHALSDNIGFQYAGWDPVAAADDLIRGLEQRGAAAGAERPVVAVILDGENCWEHYPDNGEPFLARLYQRLAEHRYLRPVTFSEHLDHSPPPVALEWLYPGSWIGHDFYIWAGHQEDQRAWEQLFLARATLVEAEAGLDEETRSAAWRHLYIAEGSDWFWWYGDDHSSADDDAFDELFRGHLRRIYELCAAEPPAELFEAASARAAAPPLTPPACRFTPVLDGRETSFFEWRPAGRLAATAGAMSRGARKPLIRRVRYGFDETDAFLAIELDLPRDNGDPEAWTLSVEAAAAGRRATIEIPAPQRPGRHEMKVRSGRRRALVAEAVIEQLIELRAPLRALPAGVGESIALVLTLCESGRTVERWPADGVFHLPLTDDAARRCDWMV